LRCALWSGALEDTVQTTTRQLSHPDPPKTESRPNELAERRKPSAMADIIPVAFKEGMRVFMFVPTGAAGRVDSSLVTEECTKRVVSCESRPRSPE
jgi:hypothetical protein